MTVRVVPRSDRTLVEVSERLIVIRVCAAPVEGKATEEARRALADALDVPASDVTLRRGHRSRDKAFEVAGLSRDEVAQRLQ